MLSPHHRDPPHSAYANHSSHFAQGHTSQSNNHPGTPFRQPLGRLDHNAYSETGNGGLGMSGMKVGRQPGLFTGRSGMNSGRPMGGMGFR